MKFTSKNLILASVLLLTSVAFASSKGTLHLQSPTIVNGTQLKPGDYKLQWDGTGPSVELSIMQGKTLVTKTTAKLVDLPSPSANDAAVVKKNDSGNNSLEAIRFGGKKFALELGDMSDGMQAGSSK